MLTGEALEETSAGCAYITAVDSAELTVITLGIYFHIATAVGRVARIESAINSVVAIEWVNHASVRGFIADVI